MLLGAPPSFCAPPCPVPLIPVPCSVPPCAHECATPRSRRRTHYGKDTHSEGGIPYANTLNRPPHRTPLPSAPTYTHGRRQYGGRAAEPSCARGIRASPPRRAPLAPPRGRPRVQPRAQFPRIIQTPLAPAQAAKGEPRGGQGRQQGHRLPRTGKRARPCKVPRPPLAVGVVAQMPRPPPLV